MSTVVAVCGLHGGAGTTTVASLIARTAAHQAPGRVLLCETSPSAGALADTFETTSPYGLAQLAQLIHRGDRPTATPWADLTDGLRLLAAAPGCSGPPPASALRAVLLDAAVAHELVVIDAGTITGFHGAVALACATQVLWAIDATASLPRCARLLAGPLADAAAHARWLLCASATGRAGHQPSGDQLASLHPSLVSTVLLPSLSHLAEMDPARDLAGAQLLDVALGLPAHPHDGIVDRRRWTR